MTASRKSEGSCSKACLTCSRSDDISRLSSGSGEPSIGSSSASSKPIVPPAFRFRFSQVIEVLRTISNHDSASSLRKLSIKVGQDARTQEETDFRLPSQE